jgi:S-adenosylmethionine hydrolase
MGAPAAMTGPSWRAAGVVSLTTDFGLTEPFVGLLKAQVLATHPGATIVDLTHGVPPFSTEAAAFWVERSARYFPPGSVHVVVVDPGVGTERRILAIETGGHLFLGPDNGVLASLAGREGATVRAIEMSALHSLGLGKASPTFHGRDVFAPLAGSLSSGQRSWEGLGSVCVDWVQPSWPTPERIGSTVRGRVIIVDSFGNCFSNIDEKSIVVSEVRRVAFGGHSLAWVKTYGERPAGTGVALINAFGVLEAAWVEGNASKCLGLTPGSPVEVELGPGPRATE